MGTWRKPDLNYPEISFEEIPLRIKKKKHLDVGIPDNSTD